MRESISSNQFSPTPLSDPLIVDGIETEQAIKARTYVESHGGTWMFLADGGYQIFFPPGTLQWLLERNERTETYTIQFPDTALMTWSRKGRINPVNGWPQGMSKRIVVPSEE